MIDMRKARDTNQLGSAAGEGRAAGRWLRGRRRLLTAAVLVSVGVSSLALARGKQAEPQALVLRPAPFAAALRGQGRLEARDVADIGAETAGRITALGVDEGDSVVAGELVARIDPGEAEAQLRSAEAAAAAARAGVTAARAELQVAEAQLAQRRDELARLTPLEGRGVSRAEVEAARAALERAEAEVARAMAGIDQALAQANAADADVAMIRRRLESSEVRSPLTGVVVSRSVSLGDVVGAGAPLLRVADPSTLYVWAPFDESVLGELRPGLPSRVRFHSDPARTYPGTVVRIGREVDVETREVQVQVTLGEAPEQWALGQRADVMLDTDPDQLTLAVASEFLAWRDGDAGVYVAEAGRARWVAVTLGRVRADQVEITDGVAPGDTILAPQGLRDRARVEPAVARTAGASS